MQDPKIKIKIYGERNTGTNYLHRLIKLNFDVVLLPGTLPRRVEILSDTLPPLHQVIRGIYFKLTLSKNLGWKHTMISFDILKKISTYSGKVIFLTITKNPYSWLLSLYNRPYSYGRKYHFLRNLPNFEDFLVLPWKTVKYENSKDFINPIDMWNKKNRSYIELSKDFPAINIKYEDLLADPSKIIDKISGQYNIKRKFSVFKNIGESTKDKAKDLDYYRDYYLRELWRENLSNKTIETINKYLDEDLMDYFGYNVRL